MREKRNYLDFIIQHIHVKHINVTKRNVTKGIPTHATNLRQDAYTITQITIHMGQKNTVKI